MRAAARGRDQGPVYVGMHESGVARASCLSHSDRSAGQHSIGNAIEKQPRTEKQLPELHTWQCQVSRLKQRPRKMA